MSIGSPRCIPFFLTIALLALAFVFAPDDGRAQPVPVTKIENAAGDSVLTVFEDGGFAVYGEELNGTIPAEGPGTRMMWYPRKAAFRAGKVGSSSSSTGDEWDTSNVPEYSVAFGVDTRASGVASTAMGEGTSAFDDASTAMGSHTIANGNYSTAMGKDTKASGNQSTAMGDNTVASGDDATAMGNSTVASGLYSTAMGNNTSASGNFSVTMGDFTTASGDESVAMNSDSYASGYSSTAMGFNTTSATPYSLSIGRLNSANSDTTSPDGTLFVAGNGSAGSASDALVLDRSGDLDIAGSLTQNSDRRLKEHIRPIGGSVLRKLGEIEPVRFRFKNEQTHPSDEQVGLVAQEVRAQFPQLVSEGASGYLSVSYSKFTAVLLKGLQEQQAEIERLRAKVQRVDKLEARLTELERRGTARAASHPNSTSSLTLGAVAGGRWMLIGLLGLLVGGVFAWRRRG